MSKFGKLIDFVVSHKGKIAGGLGFVAGVVAAKNPTLAALLTDISKLIMGQ